MGVSNTRWTMCVWDGGGEESVAVVVSPGGGGLVV